MGALDWALQNGYPLDNGFVVRNAILFNSQNVVSWAREHGDEWNVKHCTLAAQCGKLSMLQWLRENDCPWDSYVIREAEHYGHDHVVAWARANGCPEP